MASMLHSLLADKPKVPKFQKVDFGKESADFIRENQENLPAVAAFAEEYNQLSSDQLKAALERMLPGYSSILSRGTEQVKSLQAGEVPQDVENMLARRAAERGVTLGYGGGSGFGENQFLRNFGLTSLDLSQRGLDAASRWLGMAQSTTPVFNMASAFVPITQRVGIRAAENQFQFQRDWLKSQIDAIPEGAEAALITLADNIEAIGRSVLTSYAGGAMGGGMGGGGGGGGGSSPSGAGYGQGASQTPQFSGGVNIPSAPAQPSYYGGMSLNGGGSAWGSPYTGGGSGQQAPNFNTGFL